jgi:hypothetical protein
MCWAVEHIVQEIAVNCHQNVLLAILVDRGPDGEKLLLYQVELFLGLEQGVDDESGEQRLGLLEDKVGHQGLNLPAEFIIVKNLSFFEQLLG